MVLEMEEQHPFAQSKAEERAVEKLMSELERSIAALRESPSYLGDCPWCDGPVLSSGNNMERDGEPWHEHCSTRVKGLKRWRMVDGISDMEVLCLPGGGVRIRDAGSREAVFFGSAALPLLRDALFEACSEETTEEE
jgi:hypothetical protein